MSETATLVMTSILSFMTGGFVSLVIFAALSAAKNSD